MRAIRDSTIFDNNFCVVLRTHTQEKTFLSGAKKLSGNKFVNPELVINLDQQKRPPPLPPWDDFGDHHFGSNCFVNVELKNKTSLQ